MPLRPLKIAAVLVAPIAALGIYMGINQMMGNFHEMIPGELYRSAQPGDAVIDEAAQKYGVKTIINLRNEKRGAWYAEEQASAAENGVTLIDFPLSASKVVPIEESEELAEIMRKAQKPILIHCEHGANRTGLASAIYVGAVAKRSELFSEMQLSPIYGHIPIPGIGRYAMYKSWDEFEETIGF
ncbi:tyrosine/serine protein phosphatase [Neorhizobium sp. NCHU2750]|nr:tyrosine/serine protein phosphatase [Neorhizobium sp. NCHU2750]